MGVERVARVYGSSILEWVQVGGEARQVHNSSTHGQPTNSCGALSELHWSVTPLSFLAKQTFALKCKFQMRCCSSKEARPLHTYPAPLSLAVPSLDASNSRAIPVPPPSPLLAMHPQLHLPFQLHLH